MTAQKKDPKRTTVITKPKSNYKQWFSIILVGVIFLLYARTLNYQYVKMDDTDLIVDNEAFVKHLKNIPQAFKQSCFEIPGHLNDNKSYYRPVLMISFMIDAQIKGVRSSSTFHFMNILYHILVTLLLYHLLVKLGVNPLLAFNLSLLFGIHPVNAHAVSWIPGRNDILLALFTLLSLHGLIDYERKGNPWSLVLHLVAFAAALFCKESGIILLPIYFLFMWLWQKDLAFYKKKLFIPLIYAGISVLWYYMMQKALKGQTSVGKIDSLVQIVTHNLPYLFLYIGKILFPFNLNVMPGFNSMALILGCASLAILLFFFFKISNKPRAIFSLLWMAMLLGPTLLVPELPAYEHRDYLPLIGLLIGLSQASFFMDFNLKSGTRTYILGAFAAVFLIITAIRVPVFEDRFSFWDDGTDGTPFAPSACVNIGQLYQENYDHDHKKEELDKAGLWNHKGLEMDSTTLRGNNNYGAYLFLSGHPDEALPYFQKEMKYHPTNFDPIKNMGIYYREKGQPEKSVPYWEKLIKLNRFYLDAYDELANYYNKAGQPQKGMMYAMVKKELSDSAERQFQKLK